MPRYLFFAALSLFWQFIWKLLTSCYPRLSLPSGDALLDSTHAPSLWFALRTSARRTIESCSNNDVQEKTKKKKVRLPPIACCWCLFLVTIRSVRPYPAVSGPVPYRQEIWFFLYGTGNGQFHTVIDPSIYGRKPYTVRCAALMFVLNLFIH
jgi:hypothetical protein